MAATHAGKTLSARNSTTHGLFAKDAVLTHQGESRQEYDQLHRELLDLYRPRLSLERHYVRQIAQAMWRLARLQRWEEKLFANDALTDDEKMKKWERVLRHDNMLRRQIDRAVKALARPESKKCENELVHALRATSLQTQREPLTQNQSADASPPPPQAAPHPTVPQPGPHIAAIRKARVARRLQKLRKRTA